ncbi:uncharacterized protein LOC134672159 [Cydia fagiglandana]|uniref:uncharacterized protein LOC134672159 n=1 Tax=Cydia fagiglandana TaxID=1458189 RepID=UPI002FEE0191
MNRLKFRPVARYCEEIEEDKHICTDNDVVQHPAATCIEQLMLLKDNISKCNQQTIKTEDTVIQKITSDHWLLYTRKRTVITETCGDEVSKHNLEGTYILTPAKYCETQIEDIIMKAVTNTTITNYILPPVVLPELQAEIQKNENEVDLRGVDFSDVKDILNSVKYNSESDYNGVLTEILKLECTLPLLHNFLGKCWEKEVLPQDMRDANIVTLYKGKGDRGDCNCYRGISLLSIVGKLFARVVLTKLQKLAERVYPEAQCGFRSQRSTTDMIFTLRQLQEKCREQNTPLMIAFVDLNKAFDTVSREGLYVALEKIGCPPKLLSLVKSFHDGMKGSVVFNGQQSDSFVMQRGVRQGCVLAPTLFGIFFSLLLKVAFGNTQQGIHLHTRADGNLFNVKLLKSRRNREDLFLDSMLFADDAAFVAETPQELQVLLDKFAYACTLFSMSINTKKTVILAQGYSFQPSISLESVPLEVVDKFCYLGSTVSSNLSLDAEVNVRIGKAATTFGRLRTRVWNNKHLTTKTKMTVYQTCVLSILLYGAETWTSYANQERRLNTFHMRCLRSILNITWKDRVTNERVLEIAQLPSITALLKQRRLQWLGHVQRMDSARLPRQTMLSQIAVGKRNVGRPLLRFKDCAKRDMVAFNINCDSWEDLALNRVEWRNSLLRGRETHDRSWFQDLARKRAIKHMRDEGRLDADPQCTFICHKCGRLCRSRIGLYSHERRCR